VPDANQLARIGSDQLALLLPGIRSGEELARIVHDCTREPFVEPLRIGGMDLQISVRAGIALFPDDGGDADALLQNADLALQKAKKSGEQYVCYAREMTRRISDALTLENKLRRSVQRREFVLHYQPVVSVGTGRIVALEALLRWQSPDSGLVPSSQFIRLLEETGLILELGDWVLQQAVLDQRAWAEQGLGAARVAVNVSACQLRQGDFLRLVQQAIVDGTTPAAIDLELTESAVMEDVQDSVEKLNAVRELGVNIAIDDFGTGYSSLAYLATLPLAILKIDRAFVTRLPGDPSAATIVQTIITMAHSLNLRVVAEGVETHQQVQLLHRLRCDQLQGFLIGRPAPVNEVTPLLRIGANP
jgi:diguanylate cyclase